jgi:hypothetical protein
MYQVLKNRQAPFIKVRLAFTSKRPTYYCYRTLLIIFFLRFLLHAGRKKKFDPYHYHTRRHKKRYTVCDFFMKNDRPMMFFILGKYQEKKMPFINVYKKSIHLRKFKLEG